MWHAAERGRGRGAEEDRSGRLRGRKGREQTWCLNARQLFWSKHKTFHAFRERARASLANGGDPLRLRRFINFAAAPLVSLMSAHLSFICCSLFVCCFLSCATWCSADQGREGFSALLFKWVEKVQKTAKKMGKWFWFCFTKHVIEPFFKNKNPKFFAALLMRRSLKWTNACFI